MLIKFPLQEPPISPLQSCLVPRVVQAQVPQVECAALKFVHRFFAHGLPGWAAAADQKFQICAGSRTFLALNVEYVSRKFLSCGFGWVGDKVRCLLLLACGRKRNKKLALPGDPNRGKNLKCSWMTRPNRENRLECCKWCCRCSGARFSEGEPCINPRQSPNPDSTSKNTTSSNMQKRRKTSCVFLSRGAA